MLARFEGKQPDLPGGHVRHVGQQDAHPPAQRGRQRPEQVALVDPPARGGQVAPGAAHRGRVDVGGVHLGLIHRGGQYRAEGARAAAQVHHHGSGAGQRDGLAGQELGAPPGDEHGGIDGDPQAAELSPAQHVLEWLARGPPVHQGGPVGRCAGGGDEQISLLLGPDTAGRAEPGGDGLTGERGSGVS